MITKYLTQYRLYVSLILLKITKTNKDTDEFFYISTGDWSSVIKADSRESALRVALREAINKPNVHGAIGEIIIVMSICEAMKDLTLENALKFIPMDQALSLIKEDF